MVTAGVALLALIGVKLQIDATAALQADQSARDIYRGFLELSVNHPDLASPATCRGTSDTPDPAYEAYLDYLLYTAEQVIEMDPAWDPVMENWLQKHSSQLCAIDDLGVDTPQVAALVDRLKARHCASEPTCG